MAAAGDGTATAPGISFASDPNTGFYHPVGADLLGISTAGTLRWQWNAAGHLLAGTDNVLDIGASASGRLRSIYVGTSVVTPVLYGPSNVVEMRNPGGTAQAFYMYYNYTDASNYRRLAFTYSGIHAHLMADGIGTGTGSGFTLGTVTAGGSLQFRVGGTDRIAITTSTLHFNTDNSIDIGGSAAGNRPRNIYQAGGTFQSYNPGAGIANDGTNYERLGIYWSGNQFFMQTQQGGTGTARRFQIGTTGNEHLTFMTNGAVKWAVLSDGTFRPWTDLLADLGASAQRVRNIYVGGAVVNRTKAGAPVDADFTTPADGMLALDTTAHALYMRSGGTWRSVALT